MAKSQQVKIVHQVFKGNAKPDDQLDELFRQAKAALPAFKKVIKALNQKVPGSITNPVFKDRKSAERKLKNYKMTELGDLLRAKVIYKSFTELNAARDTLATMDASVFAAYVVKDRYENPSEKTDYKDIKFYLKIPIPGGHHFCELQLNLLQFDVANLIDHPIYEIIRRSINNPKKEAEIVLKKGDQFPFRMRALAVKVQQDIQIDKATSKKMLGFAKMFFTGKDSSQPQTKPVTISKSQIKELREISAKIYHVWTDKAKQSQIIKGGTLKPAVHFGDL
ncbi:MAG: hypothetical protein AAGJ28_13510 [Pseudomonadota bacterium]